MPMIPLPNEFKEQIRKMLGDEAPAFFACLEQPSTLALRIQPEKIPDLQHIEAYIDAPVPWEPCGYYLKENVKPGATVAHAAGAFYLQEASAMVSAAALDPQPGERILDLCAAPGGKTTQIAGRMAGEGLLIANEPEPSRAKVLASNLERMGVRNAAAVCAYPDALASRWPEYFDAVLCDAPCSGEGMFRRDPDSRAEWKPASPEGCAKRQAEILDQAAKLVRPGGRLVYSTCTFNRFEDEDTVLAFLDRHPDFTPEDFELPGAGGSENGMIRIWPHRLRGDGHFAAKLRRNGSAERPDPPAYKNSRDDMKLIDQLEKEICALPESLKRRIVRSGDYLYAVPEECPDMKGIRIAHGGVCLMRIGKNYIEPEHALAIALEPRQAYRSMALSDEQALRYLSGEALDCGGEKGWTLALWNGLALGWGKVSGGVLKNHLPKALRRAAG